MAGVQRARRVSRSAICGSFSASIAPSTSRPIESRRTRPIGRRRRRQTRVSIENSQPSNACSVLPSRTADSATAPISLRSKRTTLGKALSITARSFRSERTLSEYLRDPIAFLYLSGWRLGEMKALEWRDVDLAGKVVHLRPEISKNKDGRLLPLSGELLEIMDRAHAKRRPDCPFVFHRDGEPIGDFRKAWSTACKAAGLHPILVHDLRRTAVRNMVRAGIARSRGDDFVWSQDAEHLRPIQHRQRSRIWRRRLDGFKIILKVSRPRRGSCPSSPSQAGSLRVTVGCLSVRRKCGASNRKSSCSSRACLTTAGISSTRV